MAALPSPPPAPQRGDRQTFSARVDAFILWLVALIPMLNAFMAGLGTLAAGGANSFSYVFDTLTADSDPGIGTIRFDNSTQGSAARLRIDDQPYNGGSVVPFLQSIIAGTSNVKGSVRLQKLGDVNSWLLFDITGIVAASGWNNLVLVPRGGSAPSPFVKNDILLLFFDVKGDRGDGGNTPTQAEMRAAIGVLPIENGGTASSNAAGARGNLGLGNVDNTSDVNKPVSTAQNTAIQGRVSKAGDVMTGSIDFNNNVGLNSKDAGGVLRQLLLLANDNNIYFTNGGGGTIMYMSRAGTQIAGLNDAGVFSANDIRQTSDERLKHNWRRLTDEQLDALAALEKVGVFDWVDGSGPAVGASAQAIRAIVPEAVHEDENGKLTVAYGGLTFAMAQGALRRASRA